MKKFGVLLLLLFLVGCNEASGKSRTRCIDINDGLAGAEIGETEVTVDGYNEEITLWTVDTTLLRVEFEELFLNETYLDDDEIRELFEIYNQSEVEGITIRIAEINRDYVVISKVFDYAIISTSELNRIWSVDSFEDDVTLSSAIAGLEERGAVCEIVDLGEGEND